MTPARPLMRHYQLPVNGVALDTSVFGPTDRDEIMPGSAAEQTTSSATKSNHQSAIAELAMPSPSTKTMSRAHGEPWTRSSLLASGWDSLDDEPGHAWTSQTVAIPSPGRPSEGHVALIDITVVSTDSDGGKVHDNKKKRAKAKSLTTRKRSGKKKTGQKKQTKKVSSHDSDDWEEPFPLGTASPPKPAILTRARSLAESVASRSTRRRYALRRQSVRDSAPIRSEAKVRRRGGEKESSSTGTTEGSDACVHGSEDKEPKSEQERRDARPEARPAVSTKAKRKAVSSASTSAVAASDSQASVSGNDWSEEGVRLTRARKKSRIGHSLASTTLEGEEDCLVADALESTARVSSSPPRKPCNVVRTRRLVIAQETILESEGRSFVEQSVLCQKAMLREMPQCRACSVRKAGDSCRFQHLRAFPIEVQANRHYLAHDAETAFIFRQSARAVRELPVSPTHDDLNRPMDDSAKKELMRTCALALLPILEKALVHARQSHTHFRHPELQIRAMCDFCNTGLFASSYLCRRCGQEYCLSCKQSMPATNNDPKKARANQLWTCVGRNAVHSTDDLIPFSRHSVEELEDETHAMRTVLTSVGRPVSSITHQVDVLVEDSPSLAQVLDLERPFLDADTVGVADRDRCVDATASSDTGSLFGNARSFTQRICSSAASQSEEVPTLPLASFEKGTMSEADFLSVWQRGEPLIVNKVHTNVDWDPATFKDRYGDLDCEIVRCDAEPPAMSNNQRREKQNTDPSYFHRWIKTIKVSRFFDTFGASTEKREELLGKGIWKLKDWPPSAEFRESFPDIYADFNDAVPMPDYTRRDGCKNLSSLFPKNANGPDLGPKMYNAWAGQHTRGKKGTTRLHMDIADAVNVLLYASEERVAVDGHAAAQWDIFQAEDADAIREFLRDHCNASRDEDPIHSQKHFLDDDLLQRLYREKGVYSWRILQRAGQAVFIPASCAHQVCNLTDCIKVAVDFLSPQNIQRCFVLTEEFRGLSGAHRRSWKEDVLQLRAQLWYAWQACRRLGPPDGKTEGDTDGDTIVPDDD